MNVGAVALIGGGALLMHAALTSVSPLADLQSIFTSGKVAQTTTPAAVQAAINSQGTPEPSALAANPNTAATISSLANSLAAGAPNGG